jgi:hypothetical protein
MTVWARPPHVTILDRPLPFGGEWPASSRPAKVILGVVVFLVGVLVGAGFAAWITPPL